MSDDKLSDIEIKLINASRKFAEKYSEEKRRMSYYFKFEIFSGLIYHIELSLDSLFEKPFLYLSYDKEGEIKVKSRQSLDNNEKICKDFIELLNNEVPEIKDRIKVGD